MNMQNDLHYVTMEINTRCKEAENLILAGLITDGAHHKQWALERALQQLVGFERFEKLHLLNGWEKGIVP